MMENRAGLFSIAGDASAIIREDQRLKCCRYRKAMKMPVSHDPESFGIWNDKKAFSCGKQEQALRDICSFA
jgi:hypothetical protein